MIHNIKKNLEDNKPLYIKNWLNKHKYYNSIDIINKKKENCVNNNRFLKGMINFNSKDIDLYSDIIKNIDTSKYIIDEELRMWIHQKNNLTRIHYDGNGIDLINICLSGKKKFILYEPNAYYNFPFSNIGLFKKMNCKKYVYILEPGDLLLIPRFWYHEVLTLINNTEMISIRINKINAEIPNNIKMIYCFHKLLKTPMSNEIFVLKNNTTMNFFNFIKYFIYENFLIFILVLTVKKYLLKKESAIFNYGLIIISQYFNNNSFGISTLFINSILLSNLIISLITL